MNKDPVKWLKIQCIKLTKTNPYIILYKEMLSEMLNLATLNAKPTGRKGRPVLLMNTVLEKQRRRRNKL